MEVVANNFMPGDSRLVEQLVYELKSQGIFDRFRKECISDVDTKPAYQNLRQRVEGSVTSFLRQQTWSPDMNKNQVREQLRKNIYESGYLETGVERIVDQVVNPKINTIFLPEVEDVVYRFLGVVKPVRDIKKEVKINIEDLLPTDLEAVSPESVHSFKDDIKPEDHSETLNDSLNSGSKPDEDESPPFEPLDPANKITNEENSVDSHLSGFSGLQSHGSNHSGDNRVCQMEISSQDSQLSHNSSESRLSIITSEDTTKMDICDDSSSNLMKSTTNKTPMETSIQTKMDVDEMMPCDETDNTGDFSMEESISSSVNRRENESSSDTTYKVDQSENEKCGDRKNEKTEDNISDKNHDKSVEKKSKSSDRYSKDKRDDKHRKSSSSSSKDISSSKYSSSKDRDRSRKDSKSSSSTRDKEKTDKNREKTDRDKEKKDRGKDKPEKERTDRDKERDVEKSAKDKDKSSTRDKERSDKSKDKSEREKQDKDKVKTEKSSRDKEKSTKDKEREKSEKEKESSDREKDRYDKEKDRSDRSDKEKESSDKEKEKTDKEKEKTDKEKERSDKEKDKARRDKSDKERSSKDKEKSVKPREKSDKERTDKHKEKYREKDKYSKEKSSKEKETSDSKSSSKNKSDRPSSSSKKEPTDKDKPRSSSSSSSRDKSKIDKSRKESKHPVNGKTSSSSTDSKKDKDKKRDSKKQLKDDHYSSKDKKNDRRSTDRDSNDGNSSKPNCSGSCSENTSFRSEKSSQDFTSNSGSGSGESGNSDQVEQSEPTRCEEPVPVFQDVQRLIKPKFATNFQEVRRIMKIRKQLALLEKQKRLGFTHIESQVLVENGLPDKGTANRPAKQKKVTKKQSCEKKKMPVEGKENVQEKKDIEENVRLGESLELICEEVADAGIAGEAEVSQEKGGEEIRAETPESPWDSTSLRSTELSQENWEALEARLAQEMSTVNCNTYGSDEEFVHSASPQKKETMKAPETVAEAAGVEDSDPKSSSNESEGFRGFPKEEGASRCLEFLRSFISESIGRDPALADGHFGRKTAGSEAKREGDAQSTDNKRLSVVIDNMMGNNNRRTEPVVENCRYLEKPTALQEENLRILREFIGKLEGDLRACMEARRASAQPAKRGRKRKLEEIVDVKNNNRGHYEQIIVRKRGRPPGSHTVLSKVNKEKMCNTTDLLTHEKFSLPLSPAESDKSNDKKEEELLIPEKRRRTIATQRYSSDDLYKPRPIFCRRNKDARKS